MTNPFDDESASFVVLLNDEGQYSLWPARFDIPTGWRTVHPADSRKTCLDFINDNWKDMRPTSLRSSAVGPRGAATSSGNGRE
jgi:MbtH protein